MVPVTLEIKPLEGNPLRVTNLWVLNISPGPNPAIAEVVVADRRWFWSYGIVVGYYNMRRAIGFKRILKNDQELSVDFDRAEDVGYALWSLIDGKKKKYTAETMLQDVMDKVGEAERRYWNATFKAVVDDRLGEKATNLPIEDLAIQGIPGDQAVNIARAFLPAAGVRVDNDGTVTFYSRASGDEEHAIAALAPEIWGRGHTDLVRNSIIRPKEIHVLFTRKVEVRFDFFENASSTTRTNDPEPLFDFRRMDNVLPLPDYSTDGLGGRPSKINGHEIPQGSWVTFDDYMTALPEFPSVGVNKKLDHEMLQRAFIPGMDLWACMQLTGDTPDLYGNLQPWVARIAALERNYRTTFRINRRWIDRFMSWDCYRLAVLDPQTGQRGPSIAYGDYCIIPSQRAYYRSSARGKPLYYAINKTAFPGGGFTINSVSVPSPGIVTQLDHDQGILRVDYAMDLNRTYEMVLPSQMDPETCPTADIIQRTRPVAWNAAIRSLKPRLSPSFKLAIIITAVPASPSGAQQLHRIVVKPTDVMDLLPSQARGGQFFGPIMEIRVGPGREVARIRWDDNHSDTIEKIFGIKEIGNGDSEQVAFSKEVSKLCLNEGPTQGFEGASLNAIARAEAAAVYASLADRYEGSMTGGMNGGVELAGWASEIRHTYAVNGETTTSMTLPSEIPRFNMLSFLSSSERAILMRLAKP